MSNYSQIGSMQALCSGYLGFVEGTGGGGGVEVPSRKALGLGGRGVLNYRRMGNFMEKKTEENQEPSK